LYIVVRGDLRVTESSASGAKLISVLRDGDHCGEIALLIDAPRDENFVWSETAGAGVLKIKPFLYPLPSPPP
jgi:CRP-like cAMP-binding protein